MSGIASYCYAVQYVTKYLLGDNIICSAPLFRAGLEKLSVVICVNLCPFACPVAPEDGTGAVPKAHFRFLCLKQKKNVVGGFFVRYFPTMGRSLRLILCGRRLILFWVPYLINLRLLCTPKQNMQV
jgi:hypothetical protein